MLFAGGPYPAAARADAISPLSFTVRYSPMPAKGFETADAYFSGRPPDETGAAGDDVRFSAINP